MLGSANLRSPVFILARWGPGMCWGVWHAGALARAGGLARTGDSGSAFPGD